MSHFITGTELKLMLAGEDDAFAKAVAMLQSGEIGPHRFWWLATEFAIEALTGKPASQPAPDQADLFAAPTEGDRPSRVELPTTV